MFNQDIMQKIEKEILEIVDLKRYERIPGKLKPECNKLQEDDVEKLLQYCEEKGVKLKELGDILPVYPRWQDHMGHNGSCRIFFEDGTPYTVCKNRDMFLITNDKDIVNTLSFWKLLLEERREENK